MTEPLHHVDAISADAAAKLLGISYPTRFNKERERRQAVLMPAAGLMSYPPAFLKDDLDEEAKCRKAEFDRTHHLIVIDWGGEKPPGGRWRYSHAQCLAVATQGLVAVAAARQAWGLPLYKRSRTTDRHGGGLE